MNALTFVNFKKYITFDNKNISPPPIHRTINTKYSVQDVKKVHVEVNENIQVQSHNLGLVALKIIEISDLKKGNSSNRKSDFKNGDFLPYINSMNSK